MKKMAPAHTATNSNLYVIQWRWGIQKDPETMTPWQTIVVVSFQFKLYALNCLSIEEQDVRNFEACPVFWSVLYFPSSICQHSWISRILQTKFAF
jgi:hypothetical protein